MGAVSGGSFAATSWATYWEKAAAKNAKEKAQEMLDNQMKDMVANNGNNIKEPLISRSSDENEMKKWKDFTEEATSPNGTKNSEKAQLRNVKFDDHMSEEKKIDIEIDSHDEMEIEDDLDDRSVAGDESDSIFGGETESRFFIFIFSLFFQSLNEKHTKI